jgi:aspartyl-tRNA(Asn)/glutamyl-tRNA(Gln) amidotransferase subunit B
MEKGQMRLEPNVSLRTKDTKSIPNYKVEIKNINSFRFVEKAINFEIKRQMDILRNKKTPIQETRGWDEDKEATLPQRTKEEAQDYRYFPEPDIPPIGLCESDIKRIRSRLPELPDEKLARFQRQYGLAGNTVELLTRDLAIAEFYEAAVKLAKKFGITPIEIANFIINRKIDFDTITPAALVKQINKAKEKITISQETLSDILEKVFAQNPKAVLDYKSGKKEAIGFLLGAAKKYLPQNLDINQVKAEIIKKLEK